MPDILWYGAYIDELVKKHMADHPGTDYESAYRSARAQNSSLVSTYARQVNYVPRTRLRDAAAMDLAAIARADTAALTPEEALRRAAREHPELTKAYVNVGGSSPAASGAAITTFPGTDVRIEPRGSAITPNRWLVFRKENEIRSYPTERQALAFARGLLGRQAVHAERHPILQDD